MGSEDRSWEFALPLPHLIHQGVDRSDLRWLVVRGYVTFRDRARRFQPATNVAAGGDPRLMITEAGGWRRAWARERFSSRRIVELCGNYPPSFPLAALGRQPPPAYVRWLRGQAVPASGRQSRGGAFRVRGGGLADVDRRSVALCAQAAAQGASARHDPLPERQPREPARSFSRERHGRGGALGTDRRLGRRWAAGELGVVPRGLIGGRGLSSPPPNGSSRFACCAVLRRLAAHFQKSCKALPERYRLNFVAKIVRSVLMTLVACGPESVYGHCCARSSPLARPLIRRAAWRVTLPESRNVTGW